MQYTKALFDTALETILEARSNMLDLYNDTLYEDNWDENVINTFSKNLNLYNQNVDIIHEMLPNVIWTSEETKNNFMKAFNEVLLEDQSSYNLIMIRHNAYLTYRTNRKSLILQLNNVIGAVKNKTIKGKNYLEVLKYFNNVCAKIPLYENTNSDHKVTCKAIAVLSNWFPLDKLHITEKINDSLEIEGTYQQEECLQIFKKYLHLRLMVFAIFNMITSKNQVNGWQKWHNILDSYCSGDIKDFQLEKLYYAAESETDFLPTDDYQQVLDDRSWNLQGIFESKQQKFLNKINETWFDDEINYYYQNRKPANYNKANICKINMLDNKANICKIIFDGKHIFASSTFYPDDVIEICPTKNIDRLSLYTKDMRDIVFEVVPNAEWVLPFGYCQYYDIDNDTQEPNCCFIWDPITRNIIIKALRKIEKAEKLILKIKN